MKKVNFIALAMLALPVFSACTNGGDTEPKVKEELNAVLVEDLYAPGAHSGGQDTIYYSFESNEKIASQEGDWDIGFFGAKIFVNGGNSGDGKAEVALLKETIFDDLNAVPENAEFKVDTKEEGLAIPAQSGAGWYNYDSSTHFVTPIAGRVILVKTNAGNYVKMEILSFFKGNPPADEYELKDMYNYTFRYVLQPNGTKNF
ncbi:hypothetical protein FKX85_14745 [Echinicola soli]|uniref:HmuY protein n=1 Tax=Echinicola soli TaxID=2591634 RepID=A0A514CKB5_9BACT|nr:HmuY family protein [Echinicola soli]QDH80230.1 hypothetical protein FKX85_14745 [Echinicola soli]